jgi:hypothetical protein
MVLFWGVLGSIPLAASTTFDFAFLPMFGPPPAAARSVCRTRRAEARVKLEAKQRNAAALSHLETMWGCGLQLHQFRVHLL